MTKRKIEGVPTLLAAEGSPGWHAFYRLSLGDRSYVLQYCEDEGIKTTSAFLADVDRYARWHSIPFVDALEGVVDLDKKHAAVLGSGLPKVRVKA
jgi:hypothetical protein